jgi:PDZ domain-containing secreted protein
VGGPSAGAAITVLTVAVLDGKKIDQQTAMTGTINSGGVIGPVAGIEQKVSGAKAAGMKRVLIPAITPLENQTTANVSGNQTDQSNQSEPDQPEQSVADQPIKLHRIAGAGAAAARVRQGAFR